MYLLAIGIFIGTGAIVWFLWHHSRWRGSVDADRTYLKKFIEEIGAKIDRIQEQIGQIFNHLCFAYVKDEDRQPFSDDERETIQDVAYENGQKAEQVVDVFAIELRDELLEEVSLDPPP